MTESALEKLTQEKDYSSNPYAKYLHFGEKAKEKTFWSSTKALIDSWYIDGKVLRVKGHEPTCDSRNWHRYVSFGMDGPWEASFPASVCAVEEIQPDQWHTDEEVRLYVHWPMWLKDVRCYPVRVKRPEGLTVAQIQNLRECKVPELTLFVKALGSVRQTRTGNAVMDVYCLDSSGDAITVTVWDSDIEKFEGAKKGDSLTIKNGYAKEYKSVVSVSSGKFGELSVQKHSAPAQTTSSSSSSNSSDTSDYDSNLHWNPRREGESEEDWKQRLKDAMDDDMAQD